jgi:hypothetical protein
VETLKTFDPVAKRPSQGGMCGLGEPVASVLAGERALHKFQNGVIEEMRNRKFDEQLSCRDFVRANARARLRTRCDASHRSLQFIRVMAR